VEGAEEVNSWGGEAQKYGWFKLAFVLSWIMLGIVLLLGAYSEAQAPTPPAPSKILVSGQTWALLASHPVNPFDDSEDGHTYCDSRVIRYDSEDDEYTQGETIIHEFLHAAVCEKGQVHNERYNNSKHDSHRGIYFAAPKIQELIRDNPELIRFIQQAKKP
jgi:hypothetical protein